MIVFIVVPKNSGLSICNKILDEKYKNFKRIEVRGEDVPFWIEKINRKEYSNKLILEGLTGEDLFENYRLKNKSTNLRIKEKLEWFDDKAMFGKPTLCLLGNINKREQVFKEKKLKVLISAKYKEIAQKFLEKYKGYCFECDYVSGCVETGCVEGIYDLIIDIVYTGSSIKKYNLQIYEKIFASDIVLLETIKDGDYK